jgi:hypothetical protein
MKSLWWLVLSGFLLGCGRSGPSSGPTPDHFTLLKADDEPVRCSAVKALALSGPQSPGVLSALTQALDDPSGEVKSLAAIALVSFGEEARRALAERIRSRDKSGDPQPGNPNPRPDPALVLGPVEMLVYLDPWFAGVLLPKAVQVVKTDEGDFKLVAVKAVGVLGLEAPPGSPEAKLVREALEKAAGDRRQSVRESAAEFLKVLGGK